MVHSSYMAEELRAYSGLSRDRIRVAPYAVAVEQFRPLPRDAELVARYGLENQRVLLYIGRMAGNKRIDDLVRMLAAVRRTVPNTTLLLVGDDAHPAYRLLVARAKEIAAELGCAERVIFAGPVAHEELGRYYSLCDVYVTSSLHEGFCIPVIEAMAAGRPVVATDATALPETVGDAGLLFPPEDAEAMAEQVVRILETVGRDA
jgi:glycosyltransferase involved in cell wall biosynthesis